MGVATFCKAFPWHFVIDRRLELVQLGSGFMRLFGCLLKKYGTAAATYFEFHRPRSMMLSFEEIVKRANTPFVLAIRKIPQVETFPAEVSVEGWEVEGNSSDDKGMGCKRVANVVTTKTVCLYYTEGCCLMKIIHTTIHFIWQCISPWA